MIVGAVPTGLVGTDELLPAPLVTVKVTGNVPLTKGLPMIKPLEVLILKPEGNPAASNREGVFVAVTWKRKATPTVPSAEEALLITG